VSIVSRHLRVSLFYTKLSLIRLIEYPVFLQNIFLMNLTTAVTGFFVIRVMFTEFQAIGDWDVAQVSFLYSFNLMTHGIVLVVAQPIWYMGRVILGGDFDLLLVRPLDTLWLHISRGVNYMDLANPILALVMMIYSLAEMDFTFTAGNVIGMALVLVLCSVIRAALYLIGSTTCFWWRNREALKEFSASLMNDIGRYPLTVYPWVMQFILTFVIPTGFVAFYPASTVLGLEDGLIAGTGVYVVMAIMAAVLAVGSYLFFRLGLRYYESAGH
jgi:ABC-2 type transport system permease protein